MKIKVLANKLSVCQVRTPSHIPVNSAPLFVGITEDEISVVCNTLDVPENAVAIENNWRALKIEGILEFSLVGILSKISTLLADEGNSIFAISTFNTDYILVKQNDLDKSIDILVSNNYEMI